MYISQKHVDFYETLDKQLEYIWEKRKNIHIIGDLNSDLLFKGKSEEETTYGRKLLKVLENYGLVNVIKQPSRVTASTKSLMWSDSSGGRASDCRSMGRWFEPHLW